MELIDRIADAIAEIFPDITIYSENQSSGFVEPCFYINKVSTDSKYELFDIQNRKQTYQLVYFASEKTPNANLASVETLLFDHFTKLDTYASVRNREIQLDSTERTLTMTFEIWMRMYPQDHTPKMKKVKVSGEYGHEEKENS